jgi:opacity protein-like surface antigen
MQRARRLQLAITLIALALSHPAVGANWYLRAGSGMDGSTATTLRDRNCASVDPPAVFGCGPGPDHQSLAARGKFGGGRRSELAVGTQLPGNLVRLELDIVHRSNVFNGLANFSRGTDKGARQPVHGTGQSLAAFISASIDLLPYRVHPFLTVGTGAVRNQVDAITIGDTPPGASTTIRGGSNIHFAWTTGAGMAFAMLDHITLELTSVHSNLGQLETPPGAAAINRAGVRTERELGGTHAPLKTDGVSASVRWTW